MKLHFLILLILVFSFSVLGQNNPAKEFLDGKTRKYSTLNHSKAKGANFQINVPESWSSREGNRPNIIQFFKSSIPHDSSVFVTIGCKCA